MAQPYYKSQSMPSVVTDSSDSSSGVRSIRKSVAKATGMRGFFSGKAPEATAPVADKGKPELVPRASFVAEKKARTAAMKVEALESAIVRVSSGNDLSALNGSQTHSVTDSQRSRSTLADSKRLTHEDLQAAGTLGTPGAPSASSGAFEPAEEGAAHEEFKEEASGAPGLPDVEPLAETVEKLAAGAETALGDAAAMGGGAMGDHHDEDDFDEGPPGIDDDDDDVADGPAPLLKSFSREYAPQLAAREAAPLPSPVGVAETAQVVEAVRTVAWSIKDDPVLKELCGC
mmetsp:Transcript_15878/g.64017  ORF Transcript_15878/g.64017 Transcript_15878/m.64017 type:complete len:287 (-) Transcript_15878:484-1344(-)